MCADCTVRARRGGRMLETSRKADAGDTGLAAAQLS